MEAFITGSSCISHYPTFVEDYFFEDAKVIPNSPTLLISDPNYKDYIPPATIRRTSHILKMGISAGLMALQKAPAKQLDAIITGTAMGCFEDTDKFLRSIDENQERMLTPTSFIQSTHNTVAGQLALLQKCHQYNFTYVHQELSFEYALLDALMLLQEREAHQILLGGVDELIPSLVELFDRAGHLKSADDLISPLRQSQSKGYVAGEGAAFFVLSDQKDPSCQAKIKGLSTRSTIHSNSELADFVSSFLDTIGLTMNEISLVLTGINGDPERDARLNAYADSLYKPLASFKNLCGEYFTSSAFAVWLAQRCIEKQKVPAVALYKGDVPHSLKHILILNHSSGSTYSALCVSEC